MPKERQDDLRKKALARADELKQMLDAIKAEAQSVSIADGWLGDPKVCYTRRVRARVWSGGGQCWHAWLWQHTTSAPTCLYSLHEQLPLGAVL
jgi:hypothetical protein